MKLYSAGKIADIVGGTIIAGDGLAGITEFSTDSRLGGADTLFVPVIGERVDAHDFIRDAYKHGMRAVFTSRGEILPDTKGMTYIRVSDTVGALQKFGTYVRNQYNIPIVGITGSVGKTTTKEMVAAALAAGKNVLKTAGNMNSQVGLPRMMLRILPEHEIAVIEMGMSMPQEMERLARVARPETAVMTNIGVSHIGQLGSKENIRREKLNIINEFPEGGTLFINGDDPLLAELVQAPERVIMSAKTKEKFSKIQIITYGTNSDCDYHAEEIKAVDEETEFMLCIKKQETKQRVKIHLFVPGRHNILNALAALAVAEHYGVPPETAAKGLAEYRPIAMRGGKVVKNGVAVIDDTYNASPDSMKGGIDTLMAAPANRHIAVLADMLELGGLSKECHLEVGAYLAEKKADFLIAVGTEAEYYIKGAAGVKSMHFENNALALDFLKDFLREGDAVLLKGSRGMKLEEIIKGLLTVETIL